MIIPSVIPSPLPNPVPAWFGAVFGDSLDPDAAAFIAAAGITDPTQQAATDDLVQSLKAASLWTRCYALYPFIGGSASAHAKDLKGAFSGAFGGTVAHTDHASGTITGDGSTGYFDSGFNPNDHDTLNSFGLYVYCRTQTPTDARYFVGATDAEAERLGLFRSGAFLALAGLNLNSLVGAAATSSDFRKHLAVFRTSNTEQSLYVNGVGGPNNSTATGKVNRNVVFLCRQWGSGTNRDNFTNANLGFAAILQGLNSTEYGTFRGIIDTFQSDLSRANP